jgi:hypothetical protein
VAARLGAELQALRAARFHEFVAELIEWTTQGDTAYLPKACWPDL